MIHAGLCSITLLALGTEEVVEVAQRAGLEGIEWAGKTHVPHGDLAAAREVRARTQDAGLRVSSYGSYYRVGASEEAEPGGGGPQLAFSAVLETALALGAPAIRIWAGDQDWEASDEGHIAHVVAETFRVADLAWRAGVRLTFEFHGGTLTNKNASAEAFARRVEHPGVDFSWQPPHGYDVAHSLTGLRALLPRLSSLHVFCWTIGAYERSTLTELVRPLKWPEDFHIHPLADGTERWRQYFAAARTTGRDHWALLEFVKDNDPEQVIADARTLRELLG